MMRTPFDRRTPNVIETRGGATAVWSVVTIAAIAAAVLIVHLIARLS